MIQKTIRYSLLALVLLAFALPSIASAEPPADVELVAEVKGLHCGGCAKRLDKVLARVEFVKSSETSVETGLVNLKCAAKVDQAKLRKAIAEAGFQVITLGPKAPKKVN